MTVITSNLIAYQRIVQLAQVSGSGVFQVRLEADSTRCRVCNGTFRLCLGHYQAAAAAADTGSASSSQHLSASSACSYGTLTAQIEAAAAANDSQVVVDFPFAFSWPVSLLR
jgi:hypothetical protein